MLRPLTQQVYDVLILESSPQFICSNTCSSVVEQLAARLVRPRQVQVQRAAAGRVAAAVGQQGAVLEH